MKTVLFARGPQEHRGFYFSAGIGPAYHSFYATSSSNTYRYTWNYSKDAYDYEPIKKKEESTYDAFVFPAFDFRIGKSIGNFVAIYTTFDFMFDTGNWDATYTQHNEMYDYESTKTADKKNSVLISGGGGLGFDIYPFLNPNSLFRGFHIGESSSLNGMFIETIGDRVGKGEGFFLANRINVGMDWWVSETWSLGVEFSYTFFNEFDVGDDDVDRHLFRVMFRLTRG